MLFDKGTQCAVPLQRVAQVWGQICAAPAGRIELGSEISSFLRECSIVDNMEKARHGLCLWGSHQARLLADKPHFSAIWRQ